MLQMQQMAMVMQKQMHMQQQQAGMASDAPAHEQLQAMQAAQVCAATAQAQRLCIKTTKHLPEQSALCGTSVVNPSNGRRTVALCPVAKQQISGLRSLVYTFSD